MQLGWNFSVIQREVRAMAEIGARATLKAAYGRDELGLADLPSHLGSACFARYLYASERGGCTRCFPHGFETSNSTDRKNRRSWKCRRTAIRQAFDRPAKPCRC